MNDLVKITEQDGKQTVNARDLHAALEVGRDFSNWIKGRIEEYGFVEGDDFQITENLIPNLANLDEKTGENSRLIVAKSGDYQTSEKGRGGRRKGAGNPDFVPKDYLLSLGMAKELALVENNEKGRQIRRYIIKVEEAWNNPLMVAQRAAQMDALVSGQIVEAALQTGAVVRKAVLEDVKNVIVQVIRSPFPGSDCRVPKHVERSITSKGGRVYALAYRKGGKGRTIVMYDPSGNHLRTGMAMRDRDGMLTPGIVDGLVQKQAELMGEYNGHWESVERLDDYFLWKASLIETAFAYKALPDADRGHVLDFQEQKRKLVSA